MTLENNENLSLIWYSRLVVILSLNVAASATIISAHAYPHIPVGTAPGYVGVTNPSWPNTAPPNIGPHQPSVGLSIDPGHVGAANRSPVTGSARFCEYQLIP